MSPFNFHHRYESYEAVGELEMTMMVQSCRMANFRPLLRSPAVARYMSDFSQTLHATEKHKRRGMRLDAILRSASEQSTRPQGEPYKGSPESFLDPAVYRALVTRLNLDDNGAYVGELEAAQSPDLLPVPRSASPCGAVAISGVYYKPSRRSLGDSNVMFRHPIHGRRVPGRIDQIILHRRRRRQANGDEPVTETFLVMKPLRELSKEDAALDPYRRYPGVGGSLYYDAYEPSLVLRTDDVISHFAMTAMDHLSDVRFKSPCVHVRPLDKVWFLIASSRRRC